MKHIPLQALVALPILALAACSPNIAISPTTEGRVSFPRERQGQTEADRELSGQQVRALAEWINTHKSGWDVSPFVTYVPGVYVMLREHGKPGATVSIRIGDVIVGTDTQYVRQITDVEHRELLGSIGVESGASEARAVPSQSGSN